MRVLVLGSGGREHALAWRMSRDTGVERVWIMPGNPGMKGERTEPLLQTLTLEQTIEFAREQKIDFVMVGPEKFLCDGWVDALTKAGIPAAGPTRAAAKLEESKAYSKEFMTENHIPTARFFKVKSEAEAMQALEKTAGWAGVVVKLSGPALGKGVVVTDGADDARDVIKSFYAESAPGIEDGVVLEERLEGREVSLFYACLDREYRFLASACDHKRLKDGDHGPNTGGMGAISPAPFVDDAFLERVEARVIRPTLEGMARRGTPYRGILFVGLMGESVLEYNVRFGDPETQAVLPLLEGNLAEFLRALALGDVQTFRQLKLQPSGQASIHIVKAAKGYPGMFGETIQSGVPVEIQGEVSGSGQRWFFAGVKAGGTGLVSSGGRVLGLSVWGERSTQVRERAYSLINQVRFDGEQYRRDIGGAR